MAKYRVLPPASNSFDSVEQKSFSSAEGLFTKKKKKKTVSTPAPAPASSGVGNVSGRGTPMNSGFSTNIAINSGGLVVAPPPSPGTGGQMNTVNTQGQSSTGTTGAGGGLVANLFGHLIPNNSNFATNIPIGGGSGAAPNTGINPATGLPYNIDPTTGLPYGTPPPPPTDSGGGGGDGSPDSGSSPDTSGDQGAAAPDAKTTIPVTPASCMTDYILGAVAGALGGAGYARYKIGKAKAAGKEHASGYILPAIIGAAIGLGLAKLYCMKFHAVPVAPPATAPKTAASNAASISQENTGVSEDDQTPDSSANQDASMQELEGFDGDKVVVMAKKKTVLVPRMRVRPRPRFDFSPRNSYIFA